MYTKINVVENDMNFKISLLKIEMSKEINVTKYEGDIEEKLKLTLLMKPIIQVVKERTCQKTIIEN